jgi:hypothetical protein
MSIGSNGEAGKLGTGEAQNWMPEVTGEEGEEVLVWV